MVVIKDINEMIEYRKKLNGSVGFVPTMGALHKGHISLLETSLRDNDYTILSIFVNPTQFLEGEDYTKYPRKIESDIEIATRLDVDVVFLPNENDIYFEDEVLIKSPSIKGYILEGFNRPGHFDGVLRVVLKLFNIVKPNYAYFGKKDAQQLMLIKQMVRDLFLDINIVECDIVRDSDGLALSSRNVYLSNDDRDKALNISKSLIEASKLIARNILDSNVIKNKMEEILSGLDIEYIEIVDREFNKIDKIEINNSIILVVVKISNTRLLDNLYI